MHCMRNVIKQENATFEVYVIAHTKKITHFIGLYHVHRLVVNLCYHFGHRNTNNIKNCNYAICFDLDSWMT